MNGNPEFRPHSLGAQRAQAMHERTRRDNRNEGNARHRQELAEATLEEARKLKGDPERVPPLLAIVEKIATEGAAAFERYDGYGQILAVADANYRSAVAVRDQADAAHAVGAIDGEEAMRLFVAREQAHAALRARDRELTLAQKPAGCPNVGLPPQAGEKDTERLARQALKYGVPSTSDTHLPAVNTLALARAEGIKASPATAIWWVLNEARVLASLKKDEREDANKVFAIRWEYYLRTQAMSELERENSRAGLLQ